MTLHRRDMLKAGIAFGCGLTSAPLLGRAEQARNAKGIALTIGLNAVDPHHYAGWSGPLSACEFDATDIGDIAKSQGFDVHTLLTAEATRAKVIEEIENAATALNAGDLFLLHYSGHGGQLPDLNGDETDAQDETWCLFDGQLVDDELYGLWRKLRAGVRVLVLSDSCHSGTIAKTLEAEAVINAKVGKLDQLIGPDKVMQLLPTRNMWRDTDKNEPAALFRAMPSALQNVENLPAQVYLRNRDFYDAILEKQDEGERGEIGASILLISGCQDNQLSMDGQFNGLFTGVLKRTWNNGLFSGDYRDFHHQMLVQMPSIQSPNYFFLGAPNVAFERQKPFSI